MCLDYYQDGKIASKGLYDNGKKTGYWEEYYEDGSPALQGNFVNGEKVGKWTEWDKEGKKTKTKY